MFFIEEVYVAILVYKLKFLLLEPMCNASCRMQCTSLLLSLNSGLIILSGIQTRKVLFGIWLKKDAFTRKEPCFYVSNGNLSGFFDLLNSLLEKLQKCYCTKNTHYHRCADNRIAHIAAIFELDERRDSFYFPAGATKPGEDQSSE